jgi:flagellar basal-body rod protein FlgB
MSQIFDGSMPVLEKALDMYLVRHSVISDNIANAETPYYKARQVEFESELSKAIEMEEVGLTSSAIHGVRPTVTQDALTEMGQDLNTVDMDKEMSRLTKNDVQYSAATQAISKKFALMKYVISGGGTP